MPKHPGPPLSWEDYKRIIARLAPPARKFKARDDHGAHIPLFRGHRDPDWPLASTLERHLGKDEPLRSYLRRCHSAWSTLRSHRLTEMPFDLATDTRYRGALGNIPHVEFLAFLRHHGFPSPLLDWTESPYIAAFFALEEPAPPDRHPCVLIHKPGATVSAPSKPHIVLLGPFIGTAAQRHATQQCWYTAAIRTGPKNQVILCSQLEAFAKLDATASPRGSIEKIEIHRDEREKALAELAYMNITAFSLYGGVDALIKTITPRVF